MDHRETKRNVVEVEESIASRKGNHKHQKSAAHTHRTPQNPSEKQTKRQNKLDEEVDKSGSNVCVRREEVVPIPRDGVDNRLSPIVITHRCAVTPSWIIRCQFNTSTDGTER